MAGFFRTAPGITLAGVHASLLRSVELAVRAAGGVGVLVTSGYRDPQHNAAVGGVGSSNHLTGDALDGYAILPGGRQVPLGTFLRSSAGRYGLRSGDQPGFFNGGTDPVHVDDGANVSGSSSSPGSDSPSSNVSTAAGFYTLVLRNLGVRVTRGNIVFLEGWGMVEGTAAKNNPLATTLKLPGSVALPGNSAGVQQYPTPEEGARATASTIANYPHILAALRQTDPLITGITPGLVQDFGRWSGGNGADYARKVFLAAQGNPKGHTATDIGSYDFGNAAHDAGGVVNDVLAVPRFLAKITDPHNILRGLQIIAGAVLVFVGLLLLTRQVGLAPDAPNPGNLASATPAPAVE